MLRKILLEDRFNYIIYSIVVNKLLVKNPEKAVAVAERAIYQTRTI